MREFVALETDASFPSVRLVVGAAMRILGIWKVTGDRAALLELALAEAATNVVRHAYRDRTPGKLVVRLARDGDELTLAVIDEGNVFDPSSVPPPPAPDLDDPSTWPEGGLGLPIMRAACDDLSYATVNGVNTLTMTLRAEELRDLG